MTDVSLLESLLSGLAGALIATVLAVFYQHLGVLAQRRYDVMLLAVDYLDELYYASRHIQQYKDKLYRENHEAMAKEEYRALCNKTDAMLTSSRVHAHVAMVYGENSGELDKFNTLRTQLIQNTLMLFQAKPDTWEGTSKAVLASFEKQIDPLRHATELELLRGANMRAVFLDMIPFYRRKASDKRIP